MGNPASHTSPVMYSDSVKVNTYYRSETGIFSASLWSWFHQPQWDSNTNYGIRLGIGLVVNTHGLDSYNSWHYSGTTPEALGARISKY